MRMVTTFVAAAAVAVPAVAQGTADYDFKYSYPAQAARIAPLKAWLEADRMKLRAATARDAANSRRMLKGGRAPVPFRKYDAQREWKVVTDTPRFLSLSSESYSYTGGAHGGTASGGLLWDKRAQRRIDPKAVFVSNAALQAAVMPAWCKWMVAERKRRVGVGSDEMFGKCPAVKDVTVLLGSSTGRAFDRIGVIANEYLVGSYAEGQYETTLPVTPAVLRAVKPEYRGAFAVR